MTLRHTTIFLPCHSLHDFPTFLHGSEADSLLATWTTAWHPELIASTKGIPTWQRADDPPEPEPLVGELLLVPETAHSELPLNWLNRFRATYPVNPSPIVEMKTRSQIMGALSEAGLVHDDAIDGELVREFFGLGYCYLQVELLTHAMQYHNIIEPQELSQATVTAAEAAVCGDTHQARNQLERAFDLLTQARQHSYPVDPYFIDVRLFSPGINDQAMYDCLASGHPLNLLVSGSEIEQIAKQSPQVLARLKQSISAGSTSVVGGPYSRGNLKNLSPEHLLAEFIHGKAAYRTTLDSDVTIFGQFACSTSPLLPQVLQQLQFRGAMLSTFDGTRKPPSEQAKTRWQEAGNCVVDALSVTPQDTSKSETFLSLSETLGRSIQYDHVASLLFAGWPGEECSWYDDLRCTRRYGPVLGKFVTLEDYFDESATADYWLTCQIPAKPRQRLVSSVISHAPDPLSQRASDFTTQISQVHKQLLIGLANVVVGHEPPSAVASSPLERLSELIVEPSSNPAATIHTVGINAWNFDRSIPTTFLSQEVPALGFSTSVENPAPLNLPLAIENRLHNEYLELTINGSTGGIQSIKSHRDRTTRISQRLVHCCSEDPPAADDDLDIYSGSSQMKADCVEITRCDQYAGVLTSTGVILDGEDQPVARFTQSVTLYRGARDVIVDLQLEDVSPVSGDPWRNYIASRIMWGDSSMNLHYGSNWLGLPVTGRYIESGEWIDIREVSADRRSITLSPCGLPCHRRIADRALDTLLIVSGETSANFRFTLCLDTSFPMKSILGPLTPPGDCTTEVSSTSGSQHGWFLHTSAENVLVTYLEKPASGNADLCLRLLETEGRATRVRISAWKPFQTGKTTSFVDKPLTELSVNEGDIVLELEPHQWVQLAGCFAT
jgi:alpha-mannosidase